MLYSVHVPVADLRAEPKSILANDYTHQDARLSQLSYGDPLILHHQENDWFFVSVPEQLRVKNKQWRPYQGWIHRTEATPIQKKETRASFTQRVEATNLIRKSIDFIDLPYLWGGCSPAVTNSIASVDCSGLIYQLFKKEGRLIPRDAHDQYLAAKPIVRPDVGDLLFLTPLTKRERRITHVMMLHDKDHYLESPESGKKVRLLKIGKEISQKNGLFHIFDRDKPYFGYFGRLI